MQEPRDERCDWKPKAELRTWTGLRRETWHSIGRMHHKLLQTRLMFNYEPLSSKGNRDKQRNHFHKYIKTDFNTLMKKLILEEYSSWSLAFVGKWTMSLAQQSTCLRTKDNWRCVVYDRRCSDWWITSDNLLLSTPGDDNSSQSEALCGREEMKCLQSKKESLILLSYQVSLTMYKGGMLQDRKERQRIKDRNKEM